MTPSRPSLGSTRSVAARLFAATVLLVAQILGAALAGASLAAPSRIELCVGPGAVLPVVDPDGQAPAGHRHEFCPCCLAGCIKTPVPGFATAAPPARPMVVEGWRIEPGPPLPSLTRTLRPPGRAPPERS